MSGNPRIEFGLSVLKTAMLARTGRCTDWDVIRLQETALRCVHDLPEARAMVLAFVGRYRGDAMCAGEALQASVLDWIDTLPTPMAESIQAETAPVYDWQKRADLQ